MSKVLPLAAVVVLAAALIVPPASAKENPTIEIPPSSISHNVSSSLLWWTSYGEFTVAAPLAFNTPVYEATISAYHTSLDFLSGQVTGWSDPENNGAWTGSWTMQSVGFGWDGWTLRSTRWTHIIKPSVSNADVTGTFIARQFDIDWGQLHTSIELGVGGASGYSQGIWGQAAFPTTSAEGIATIIYSLSPSLQLGYKIMDWATGSGSIYWSGGLAEFHEDF